MVHRHKSGAPIPSRNALRRSKEAPSTSLGGMCVVSDDECNKYPKDAVLVLFFNYSRKEAPTYCSIPGNFHVLLLLFYFLIKFNHGYISHANEMFLTGSHIFSSEILQSLKRYANIYLVRISVFCVPPFISLFFFQFYCINILLLQWGYTPSNLS